jgi:peptidoglycan hydrolase-like protein with peptidoglycan-binding domain
MKVIDILLENVQLKVPQGNRGPEVAMLQHALVALGYQLPRFGVDGIRGPETSAAIRKFQKDNNIQIDGIPGPETVKTFNTIIAANPAIANTLKTKPAVVKKRAPKPVSPAQSSSSLNVEAVLAQIRQAEGGRMGYNAINRGKAGDTPDGMPGLTDLTIAEVRNLQRKRQVFAAGAYQIIPTTMDMILSNGVVSPTDKFNKETQDKMGRWLVVRRINIANRKGTDPQKELSKEFASIADPSTGKSYYFDVGNNKASIASLTGNTGSFTA